MDRARYERIVSKISATRNLYDKKRAKASNQTTDPTTQLIEIEGHINRVLKFIKLAKIADAQSVAMHIKELQSHAKTQKQLQLNEQKRKENEDATRRLEVRKQ
mmetsp:Transcript_10675/g.13245  ORF Transcript_10675/g.13245 Transcript_10675/m.13245 type:complete len:103 (+) Transcript_10675:1292-1600(+)